MSQSKLFSSGLELASLVANLGLLRHPWMLISQLSGDINSNQQQQPSDFSLEGELYKESDSDYQIIAFVTKPCTPISAQNPPPNFVSSVELRENNVPHFEFLCSKNGPPFYFNKTAVDLFCSHHEQLLSSLKSQIDHSKPLIVTGHALGGSIAALFTLWLLGNPAPGQKGPLCITFGSPLIGDQNLQKIISENSTWNSCFLNVASHLDPVPRLFISNQHNTQTIEYKPFGTFLLSSDRASTCSDDPESVLKLLKAMGSMNNLNQGMQTCDYGAIVENLRRKAICKDSIPLVENIQGSEDPLLATITMQLRALGFSQIEKQLMDNLKEKETNLQNKKRFDASKKLHEGKIYMVMLEWYKKKSKMLGVGYYDKYKNQDHVYDHDAVTFKKKLTKCWEDIVREAEKKPQKEGAKLRKRWLTAGTNYRLMVEPMDIAEYYKDGNRDYVNQGRSTLYIQLEEWLKEAEANSNGLNSSKKENPESILTLDSCFWARVEEAILLTQELADENLASSQLIAFEDYVFDLLKNCAVSSEIFLDHSSFMKWWNDYKKIVGDSRHSALANFMNNHGNYEQYAKGEFAFP